MKDYTAFNFWANEININWLKSKPLDLLEQPFPSSFPSLRETLLHIWSAEDVWLQRLQGHAPTQFVAATFTGSSLELMDNLLRNSAAFRDFIGSREPDYFAQKIEYVHRDGKIYHQFTTEIIQHCMQHGTYHRGQIVTIARNLGLTDPPKQDYIEHCRNR
jgi:uncharacterized damage-inducible protein DinB